MISVVILNFNGKRYLEACLTSVLSQTFRDFEVIIVDNGSSDGSAEYLATHYPWVKVVKNEKNLGFAGGTNSGIRQARGEYILTLNNDTHMHNRFLECLVRVMKSDKSVGMCAPKMLFCDGRINSTGICLSRSGAAWDRGMSEPDKGQYDIQEEVFGPCAGAALYRREMLEEIGLFDEDFFAYGDDTDIGLKGRLAGWKCLYIPEAVVYHRYSQSSGSYSPLKAFYVERNRVWIAVKYFPLSLLLKSPFYTFWRFLLQGYGALTGRGAAGKFSQEYSRWQLLRVLVKAYGSAIQGFPKMWKKRKSSEPRRFSSISRKDFQIGCVRSNRD